MHSLHQLYEPEFIKGLISTYGYWLLFAIIFAETGLLIGFFLPGDSLLFIAGTLCAVPMGAAKTAPLNIAVMIPLLCVAAVLGDGVGYLIGRKAGPALLSRPDSRFFKRRHILNTQTFYEKHGPKTIVMARFVPIARTFAPTVAGIAGMKYRDFVIYNIIGGVGWICSVSLLGYFLGNVKWIQNNLEKASIVIILLSISPMIIHWLQERRKKNHAGAPVENGEAAL